MRLLIPAGLALLAACSETPEAPPVPQRAIAVSGHFGPEGMISENVSGLACDWQRGGDNMRCLAIEDEGDSAQWATFNGTVLAAGQRFPLTTGEPLGTPPQGICGEADPESREMDGEAVAHSEGVFYVAGAHGCARQSNDFRLPAFLVARIAPDEPTGPIVPGSVAIATSYRLAGMMQADPLLAPYFGGSLFDANGLNIEGLAVDGDRMLFGLRGPSVDGTAYLFETSATALFSRRIAGSGRAIPVPLGQGAGIRDLAFLPDGRLLILSGPALDSPVPYRLRLRSDDGSLRTVATIDPHGGGEPEAIAIVAIDGDTVSLLILFDGAEDGAPQPFSFALPG